MMADEQRVSNWRVATTEQVQLVKRARELLIEHDQQRGGYMTLEALLAALGLQP